MTVLVLALLLAAPRDAQASNTLPQLAREAAPIALVKIERLQDVQQEGERIDPQRWPDDAIRVAEAAVERCLLGAADLERVVLTLRRPGPDGELHELAPGERALVFLDARRPGFLRSWASSQTRARLEQLAGPGGPHPPLPAGVWRVQTRAGVDVAVLPPGLGDLPETLASELSQGALPLEPLLDWLDAELDRVTPAVGAVLRSTGPFTWSVQVDPDGTYQGTEQGRLEPAQLAALWNSLESERFFDLPGRVGWWREPDQSSYRIWTRRRDGYHPVEIYVVPPEQLETDEARQDLARALRALDALPGAKRPRLGR